METPSADDTFEVVDEREPGWWWVDNAVVDDYLPRIGPAAFAAYCYLARMANSAGSRSCFPSHATIAAAIGVSKEYARHLCRQLRNEGLISATARKNAELGDQTSNLYTINKTRGRVQKTGGSAGQPSNGEGTDNRTPRVQVPSHDQDVPDQVTSGSFATSGNCRPASQNGVTGRAKREEQPESGRLFDMPDLPKPDPNALPCSKSKPRAPKPKRSTGAASETPSIKQVLGNYVERCGYPLTGAAREAAAAKRILANGYAPEEIDYCHSVMQKEEFWNGKPISLASVEKRIGPLIAEARREYAERKKRRAEERDWSKPQKAGESFEDWVRRGVGEMGGDARAFCEKYNTRQVGMAVRRLGLLATTTEGEQASENPNGGSVPRP